MRTDRLRINELPEPAYRWYLEYLGALDAKDIDAYGAHLAPDVELVMNNAEPVSGHAAVTAGLAEYWQSFGELEHDLLSILGSDRAFVLEALNHYTTLDGRQVTLRAVAFTDRDERGRVTSVRLFSDTTPLFSAAPGNDRSEARLMLGNSKVAARLPAQNLDRARAFYAEKLGLEPSDERPGGLLYRVASGEFAVFASAGGPSGDHTQMGFEVDDIEAVVAALQGRGVVFEEYDIPGMTTHGALADIDGNYPSKNASGERAAWFRDSEGNLLGLAQLMR
jgi:catechol 2,3-dioxygenase-like lactoylglutathione lyase family enzyme/ketosteroid isomerase-like protein